MLVAVDDPADVAVDAVADGGVADDAVADDVADAVADGCDDLEDDGGPGDDCAVFLSPQFPRPAL